MAKCRLYDEITQGSSGFKVAFLALLTLLALALAGLSGCAVETQPQVTPAVRVTGTVSEPQGDLLPSATASATAGTDVGANEKHGTPFISPVRPDRVTVSSSADEAYLESEARTSGDDLLEVTVSPARTATKKAVDLKTAGSAFPVGSATTNLNIRSGPGTGYPVVGLLETGHSAQITGVCPSGDWWRIRFDGTASGRGWVSGAYIIARNTENVPVVQPPGLPPTVVMATNWRGEYFTGTELLGSPDLVRDDAQLSFNWEARAPAEGLPADGFSVRWSRDLNFSAGTYRFYAHIDDGVRFWIDGEPVIDQWHDSTPTTYCADRYLAEGKHRLVMEYYERSGNAIAQLAWERLEGFPDWRGEYYANPSLSGAPALVRNDVAVDFHWDESPGPGVPADNFSARWTRTLFFPGYVYNFGLNVDDGARLWVDDRLIIDAWQSGAPRDYSAEIGLSEGNHTVKLEYFEFRYGAHIYLNWQPVQDGPSWEAEYFDNRKLNDDPVLERDDGLISFNWGTGAPGAHVPADDFSARWRQDVEFEGGTYAFSVLVDDGARLWVDDVLLIDCWQEGRVRLHQVEHHLSHGTHRVKVEYFEHTGHAQIEVSWERK